MEQRWKALHDDDLTEPNSYYSSSYSSWLNYGSSLINNVLMNIHLKISSIHIRYEDYSTISGCTFATGIVIRSLTICSTDENWQPKFVTGQNFNNDNNFLFKLIDLESFACYFDVETLLFSEFDFDIMVDYMRKTLDRNLNHKNIETEHDYMIAPVNGKCYLKRNCSEMSLKSCKQPRTVIDVQLECVPIMMTAIQYKHLLDWSIAFQTHKTLWRYRKWRPMINTIQKKSDEQQQDNDDDDEDVEDEEISIRYEFKPKTWWHFAVNANLEDYRQRRQRFNWHFILQRARDIVGYHNAYLCYLIYPESFSRDLRCLKERVENEFTLDELCSIREIVFWRANQILKKQLNPTQDHNENETITEQSQTSSGYWFLPFNVLSNLYYSNYSSNDTDQKSSTNANEESEQQNNDFHSDKHSNPPLTSSSLNLSSTITEDIFITRDAIYCQFNFQIHNSSFQLMAFNNLTTTTTTTTDRTDISESPDEQNSQSFFQNKQQQQQQGNLILEFEFNQMKIGIDITNPNAYACSCHNRDYNNGNHNCNGKQLILAVTDHQQQQPKNIYLTQNELNQLQLDLNFECQNLNLTLLRTDDSISTIITENSNSMQKLATAIFIGCGWQFRFSSDMLSIDGRMDSLELLDLITAPNVNRHRRVLSIGKTIDDNDNDSTIISNNSEAETTTSIPVEKALMFSLSRHMNENILRLNIEMASFCYVHSSILVYELSLCRKCFSDVLEAYFSRAFKERFRAATTEVLRGIVPDTTATADSMAEQLNDVQSTTSPTPPPTSIRTISSSSKLSLFKMQTKSTNRKTKLKSKNQSMANPFVDNFKLNVFIRSPVIICPISPSSHEVVVFHLGHMLLNNHNHSTDIIRSVGREMIVWKPAKQRQRKFGTAGNQLPLLTSSQNSSSSSATTTTTTSSSNNSYNAEIRDLSVYSLDCSKNIEKFAQHSSSNRSNDSKIRQPELTIPVDKLYYCDMFGVPILQKTVIEIVLERKILFSSMNDSMTSSTTTTTTSSSSFVTTNATGKKSSDSVNIVDGLNLISSVNSIDPLVLPKKFSIRQHFCSDQLPAFSNDLGVRHKNSKNMSTAKPEMVLSIEISAIDVRFSYTDLLVFWHILNTLTSIEQPISSIHSSTLDQNNSSLNTTVKPNYNDDNDDEMMEMLQQITLSSSGLNAEEFRSRLNNLIDLGFNPRESLRALALKNGDIIEAAYMLSSPTTTTTTNDEQNRDDQINQNSDTDNHSQCTSDVSAATTTDVAMINSTNIITLQNDINKNDNRRKNPNRSRSSNLLLSILSVIEVKISNGSIRIIDDCNQLDLPLLELGVTDFRLMQYYTRSIEAHAQTNFYCDYYNSHLSGWEPFIENCQVAFSWKHHEPRCHLKSMLNTAAIASTNRIPVARQKLAIKIEIRKMFNMNISRTLLDLIEKVHRAWRQDIEHFMSLPSDRRTFRHRQPFIPFALKNDTGTDLHMYLSNSRKMFSTEKAADLITPCDLKPILDVQADHIVYFDCVDLLQSSSSSSKQNSSHKHRQNLLPTRSLSSSTATISQLKIYVKVDGWQETFPLSIEREGTFIRHVISERYTNQSAILVFEIQLQSTAIKLITVRSSLLITNRTTKMVELKFVNTAMSDVRTSYMIAPHGIFPVPLDLLYARIQLRPCDLGIGTCSTYVNWNHVRKFGELDCSLQICTPITHTQHGSYSKSQAYVVSVLVERNSIGALIESRNIFRQSNQSSNASMMMMPKISPLVTLPSHTITLLPPLQLANRLPYELRFKIINNPNSNGQSLSSSTSSQLLSSSTGTIKSGDDYSVHYISPLESFSIEFQMEHFPRCRPLHIEPGAIKNFETHIDMYDARNRLLILNAHIAVQTGCPKPSNAMTITIYAPYWIVNRSGLPLVFAQDGGTNQIAEAAGQYEEHERARSISPLLFSFADPDSSHYCIMRLGRMLPHMSPRWCNLFCLEKGTFYRRLRVTEYSQQDSIPQEKIYEFGIDIRQGRDRYNQTKIVTIAPRFQIENLTSFKLEFAQKCFVQPSSDVSGQSLYGNNFDQTNTFSPSLMSSPIKSGTNSHRNSFSRRLSTQSNNESVEKSQIISALPKSNMPFHWPATDRPKLLCVRIASLIGCLWSGCFDVGSEPSVSFQLNIRDDSGRSNFIRVEILLQNATYFIVFTDANSLPPPIRVENFSQVAIEFYQIGCSYHRTIVRPNSSVPYALDEPTQPPHLTVCAPGGSSSTYDLNSFAPGNTLTYDNFYYLAFEETFTSATTNVGVPFTGYYMDDDTEQLMYMMMAGPDLSFVEHDVGSKMLVLDVPDYDLSNCPIPDTYQIGIENDRPKPVFLGRKERAKRSQLWRLDQLNHLIHEGSSPPSEPPGFQDLGFAEVKFPTTISSSTLMVLDVMDDEIDNLISNAAFISIPLAVRKLNPQRSSTQTWHFTEDGRLRCLKYWNMFVQPVVTNTSTILNDIFQTGTMAVIALGPTESMIKTVIPRQQAMIKQKMRKGSGVLNVSILADGPSRVLRIKDNQLTANGRQLNLVPFNRSDNSNNSNGGGGGGTFGTAQLNELLTNTMAEQSFLIRLLNKTELELQLQIDSVGISIISKMNEEIIFLFMKKIILELLCNPAECRLNCVVEDFQVCFVFYYL